MIAVVDYGMGNLRNVQKALQRVGADARVVSTPAELGAGEKIVLPGVGAFGDAIQRLRSARLAGPIVKAVREGTPFFGICLGLQLLFDVSYENGEHTGLGLLPGKVVRFDFPPAAAPQPLSVPHMGWNRVSWTREDPLTVGLCDGEHMYFAHSFHVVPLDDRLTVGATEYGYRFTSAVRSGNLFATQFHPEKSQAVGLRLLRNFASL